MTSTNAFNLNRRDCQDVLRCERRHEALKAEHSLYVFLQQAWRAIEGEMPFTGGWHIEAIAEHLEACFNRQIQRLLIRCVAK